MASNKSQFLTFIVFISLFIAPEVGSSQWSKVGNSFYGGNVTALAAINEKIFAGTYGGVFVSDDNAESWETSGGLLTGPVRSMLSVGNTLYVALQTGKNYKSTDNGTSWIPILEVYEIREFAAIGNTIFAVSTGGVFFSMDNSSANISIIPTGLSGINSMTISNSKIFLGTASSGLYSSSDLGLNWELVNTGFTGNVLQLESVGPIIVSRYLSSSLQVVISVDNGSSWNSTGLTSGILSLAKIGDQLIIGNSASTYQSSDNGVNWSEHDQLPNGMGGLVSNSSGYYYGTSTGVYRSLDSGFTWTGSNAGMTSRTIGRILSLEENLIIGLGGPIVDPGGLFSLIDNDADWMALNQIPNLQNIYMFAAIDNWLLAGTFSSGVFLSTDGGENWETASGIDGATCLARLGNDVYAGNTYGIYVSHDIGLTWSLFSSTPSVHNLAANEEFLFASNTPGEVFRFTPDGQSESIQNGLPPGQYSDFVFAGNKIICRSGSKVAYSSTNNGSSWSVDNRFTGLTIASLVQKDNYLFIAKPNEGVFYSFNGGDTWLPFNDGLPDDVIARSINYLCLVDGRLYATTNSSSVWATSEDQVHLVTGDISNPDNAITLNIFPNPACQYLKIDISSLRQDVPAKIELIDSMGRVVLGMDSSRDQIQEMEVSSLSKGLYVVRVSQLNNFYYDKVLID